MRTHTQIIDDAGGYQKVAERIGEPATRVRFWARRDSIPAEVWKRVADKRVASLTELASAAEARRADAA